MYLLDTDHMSILRRGGAPALNLQMRLGAVPDEEIVTCVVVYEEQMRGWLAEIAHIQVPTGLISPYESLTTNLEIYCGMTILPFDAVAASHVDAMKRAKIRLGTQDMRIAAIALANNATVLSRNIRDFSKVPGLIVLDWTV